MGNFFRKFIKGKKVDETTFIPKKRVVPEYPGDYSEQCLLITRKLKAGKRDYDEIEESGAEELFSNSIEWIDAGLDINLESFLQLIKAIRTFIPSDCWREGNGFRSDYDLYIEGITNKEFFLNSRSSEFLLDQISIGEDGHHLACLLLSDFGNDLSEEFVASMLESLLSLKKIYECEHIQAAPTHWEAARDLLISGSPFIELIRSQRLNGSQLLKVYEHILLKKRNVSITLISTIELYLAMNPATPEVLLSKLSKSKAKAWGWIEVDGVKDFAEVLVSEFANETLKRGE